MRERSKPGAGRPVPPLQRGPPRLVAIVGGSGAGKTRLATMLEQKLAPDAARLTLDSFYVDRSHLPLERRAGLNFDAPTSIDWRALRETISESINWRPARIPRYDFTTHCRLSGFENFTPKPIILLDGLWVLRPPWLRRLLSFSIFLNCPMRLRLNRRLRRDMSARGRTSSSVREQFRKTVEPMHRRYVLPQRYCADAVLPSNWGPVHVRDLADRLRELVHEENSGPLPLRRAGIFPRRQMASALNLTLPHGPYERR